MRLRSIYLFVMLLAGTPWCFGQGSADQHKYSPTNQSGVRYDNFSPKEKPLAPSGSSSHVEAGGGYVAGIYMPHKDEIDKLWVKSKNAITRQQYEKSEKYCLEAISIIGLENYHDYRNGTYSFRQEGFFQVLYYARYHNEDHQGAMDACDSMLKYEPEIKDAIDWKTDEQVKLSAIKQ